MNAVANLYERMISSERQEPETFLHTQRRVSEPILISSTRLAEEFLPEMLPEKHVSHEWEHFSLKNTDEDDEDGCYTQTVVRIVKGSGTWVFNCVNYVGHCGVFDTGCC
jgi:hypothetical protein